METNIEEVIEESNDESQRKLAYVATITNLEPIEGADRIEKATINEGWAAVVKKGEFNVGDLCVFIEIDSVLPSDNPDFEFLKDKNNPEKPVRLRTIRMKGQISQGLALPYSLVSSDFPTIQLDQDLTEYFKIKKYSPPVSGKGSGLGGIPKGNFPAFIQKTDEERIQTCFRKMYDALSDTPMYVSEKLDGCLKEDTVLITKAGKKKIKDINTDDYVLAFNHTKLKNTYTKVKGVKKQKTNKKWYKIRTKSGHILEVTGNHKVFLPELNIYRRVDELECGDKLQKN